MIATISVLLAIGYVLFAFVLWRLRIEERKARTWMRLVRALEDNDQTPNVERLLALRNAGRNALEEHRDTVR